MINITTENSIFLFIDIQEKLVSMLKDKIKQQTEKNCYILAKTTSLLNIKTIITEQYPKGLGSTIDIVKKNINNKSLFFEKFSFNALDSKEIRKTINKKNIFVFGIETHICVYQTVLNLLKSKYNVFVIKDACASRDKNQFETSINLMKKSGAKIITTEMVLFGLLKSSKNPKFKELQALIK